MIRSPQQPPLSPEAYLRFEEQSDIRHEYVDGQIYAMGGASDSHVTITVNLVTALRPQLRGTGCRIYASDMKVFIEKNTCFYYPDLLITCDERDRETPAYKRFPRLIVEVLSASTEAFDRGDKFSDYQRLDSLQEYVLISTKRREVQCFRRSSNNLWILQTYTAEQPGFALTSVAFEGSFDVLYEDVVLP